MASLSVSPTAASKVNNSSSNTPLRFSVYARSSSFSHKMAGDIRVVSENSNVKQKRKLWSQNFGDSTSLNMHLLKENLAAEGCQRAQLALALKLLNESSTDSKGENARLAIYWLVKSSEQGNEEATKILKECLQNNIGINLQNIVEIEDCLTTSKNEKLTFLAARLLFEKLSNGEEFITTTQLINYIQENLQQKNEKSQKSATVSEESVLANNEPKKSLPESVQDLKGNSSEEKSKNESKIDHQTNKILLQRAKAKGAEKLSLKDMIGTAGCYNEGKLCKISINSKNKILPRHNTTIFSMTNLFILQFVIFFLIAKIIDFASFGVAISFLLSLYTSYNFLIWRKKIANFQDWTSAFKGILKLDENWSEKKPAFDFLTKNLAPHLFLSGMSLTFFIIFPGGENIKIFSSIISTFTLFRLLITNCKFPSANFFIFFLLKILPKYSPQLINDVIDYNNNTEFMKFCLNMIPNYIVLPCSVNFISFVKIFCLASAFFKTKEVILKQTLPEVLTIFWILLIFKLKNYITFEDSQNLSLLAIGVIISLIYLAESNKKSWKLIFTLFASIIFGVLFSFYVQNNLEVEEKRLLSWSDYEINCQRPFISGQQSIAETQYNCHNLFKNENPRVNWTGIIKKTQIVSISSMYNINIEILVKVTETGAFEEFISESQSHFLSYFSQSTSKQEDKLEENIVKLSVYTSEIWDIQNKEILNLILQFKPGDKLEFAGTLTGNFGNLEPVVSQIQNIKCISCANNPNGGNINFKSSSYKLFNFISTIMYKFYITLFQSSPNAILNIFE